MIDYIKEDMCVFDGLREEYDYFTNQYESEMIEEIAQRVKNQYGEDKLATPIASILGKVGFKMYLGNLDNNTSGIIGVSDRLKKAHGSKRVIKINNKESRGHQRFTLAHELGHYIFDYDGKTEYANAYTLNTRTEEPTEKRANRFAAALLMPQEEFTNRFKLYKKSNYDIITIITLLSIDFDVSETAVEKRIEELKLAE